jgi:hypothetical protein
LVALKDDSNSVQIQVNFLSLFVCLFFFGFLESNLIMFYFYFFV